MTEAEYQLQQELAYLRNEIKDYTGEETTELTAVETARKIISDYREQQAISNESKHLLDNINQAFSSFKVHLKAHCKALGLNLDENLPLSESMQLAVKIIDAYHDRLAKLKREINLVEGNLQVLAESESHCTRNNWQMSKDGIIQALTLRLCGESRDRLQRVYQEYRERYDPKEF